MPDENHVMTCSPSELLAQTPCLRCLSQKELWAILLYLSIYNFNEECRWQVEEKMTVAKALKEGACWNCTTKTQRLQALVSLLANSFGEEITPAFVRNQIKCLECASETQIQAAVMYMFCQWWWCD